MRIQKDCEFMFRAKNAANWLLRGREQRPNAIFPTVAKGENEIRRGTSDYVYSMDPKFLALTEFLAEELTREFPIDLRGNGFAGDTGVGSDWLDVLNTSGMGMIPLPIPISDNGDFIRANGIAEKIRAVDEPWLDKLIELFFGHVAPADCYIRKEASTSLPEFTTNIEFKKEKTLKALLQIDDFLKKATGGDSDLVDLLNDYDSLFVFAIHERQQPNKVKKEGEHYYSKPRTAPTEEEARSGSYAGKTQADMSIKDEWGNVLEKHFRMRRRDVFGANGPINYVLTAIVGCFRKVYLERFSFTYKMRSHEEKEIKSARFKHIIGADVKTMDKLIPKWFMEYVFNKLPKFLDERVVEVMRRMFQAPYVCPQTSEAQGDKYNPVFGGSPLKVDNLKQHPGLPSGIAFNPDWGKLWMTFVYLILFRDCGALFSPAEIEPLLRGQNSQHALFDMSDDATLLTNSDPVARRLRSKPSSPYAILEIENPVIYLGGVFCETGRGRRVVPNPVTFIVNAVAREDSVDDKTPETWARSYQAREIVYGPTPIFRDLKRIFEGACMRHLGFNPATLARDLAKLSPNTTMANATVLDDSRAIHYKVDPEDVDEDILNQIVAKVPAGDFYDKIKHLFKVPTVAYEELA